MKSIAKWLKSFVTKPVNSWKLSPSDFAFLYNRCPRCFYNKVRRIPTLTVPGYTPIAKIFNTIDSGMKAAFNGIRTEAVCDNMPAGVIEFSENLNIESLPFAVDAGDIPLYFKGKYDARIKLDDGTYAIIDFKTTQAKQEKMRLYSSQLHSYAHSVENSANKGDGFGPVTKLGLLIYEPALFTFNKGVGKLEGKLTYIPIPRDDNMFFGFLREVYSLLKGNPPPCNETCQVCNSH
jgi:hypothetical protein